MAVSFCLKSRTVRRLLSVVMICAMLPNGFAWGGNQQPLSRIPVPEPPNLSQFVVDKNAAIRLGKALYWDMQAGSDGIQACASCHYRAGADPVVCTDINGIDSCVAKRDTNQLHPGPDTIFGNNSTVLRTFTTNPLTNVDTLRILRADGNPRLKPNYTLQSFDFPLFQLFPTISRIVIDPLTGFTSDPVTFLRDTNDVVGSQGIRLAQFTDIDPDSDQDLSTPLTDQLFNLNGTNIRQVTGRNSPSTVNAVFNFTNFWDGRANNIFNGVNPLGPLDQGARIWVNDPVLGLVQQAVAIPNASLASQATGPPLSDVEMSFKGRTFPDLGKKMLNPALMPLGKQQVHASDGVLGAIANPVKGLNTTYAQMVRDAFRDIYWNSNSNTPGPGGFTQMEANFSLFWGLAIQLYEATLVSDKTPFDRFQSGNQNALSPVAQRGLATFDSKCAVCHSGSEFTTAAVGSAIPLCVFPDCNRVAFTNNTTHSLIKFDINPTTFSTGLIDAGFFNIGVRPTAENPGRGAGQPDFPFPLSFTQLALLRAQGQLPFATPRLASVPTATVNTKGSFKTPGLRNVELTPPYFHNGDALTLDQVVEFYTNGGKFPGNPELAAAMQPIGKLRGDPAGRTEVVEFLKALTDERVRNEWAPFDHPELVIPNGVDPVSGADIMIPLPATGGAPAPVPPVTLTLNPVTTPSLQSFQLLSGTVDSMATVTVSVNGGTPIFATVPCVIDPLTLACTTDVALTSPWSATVTGLIVGHNSIAVTATSPTGGTLTAPVADIQVMPSATISGIPPGGRTTQNSATLTIGGAGVVSYQYSFNGSAFSADIPVTTPIVLSALADGTHTIIVLGKDVLGNQQPATLPTTGIWFVKANPPVLTLNAINSPTGSSTQTISGTVELGSTPSISVDTSATVGPVRTVPGSGISTWSCVITGLAGGANTVTVIALDGLFNTSTVSGVITRVLRDGNFKGSGIVDISDALKALRFSVSLEQPTATDMIHGDVAPLVNGLPTQNDRIDIADALLILRKTVGLVTF